MRYFGMGTHHQLTSIEADEEPERGEFAPTSFHPFLPYRPFLPYLHPLEALQAHP